MATDNYPDPPEYTGTLAPSERKSTKIPSRTPVLSNAWEFAGWGQTRQLALRDLPSEHPSWEAECSESSVESNIDAERRKLGQLRASSITGNAVVASVLYTIGLAGATAGPLAPISLLIGAMVLAPLQRVLVEVGTALPLNGGIYTLLLNTSSKTIACFAASLSLLDYTATAVVSAASAAHYASGEFGDFGTFWPSIGVLVVFAFVAILGCRESANVSVVIYIVHCTTLLLLMVTSIVAWVRAGNTVLYQNWSEVIGLSARDVVWRLFSGYSIGLLGVTGFEMSSNFIEEQRDGVFAKTTRNMWWSVFIFNAPIMFLATAVMPLAEIRANQSNVLSVLAERAAGGGSWLRWIVAVDAVIVLSAGVLTSMLGVSGLAWRMAEDRILPAALLSRNRFTATPQWIILSFLAICILLFAGCAGDVTNLSGVFAVAFLSVMATFTIGNLLLKYTRGRLRRDVRVDSLIVLLSLGALIAGMAGTIVSNPVILGYFCIYFGAILFVMLAVLHRTKLAKAVYFYVDKVLLLHRYPVAGWLVSAINSWKSQPIIFFTDTDELHILNKAALYIKRNEATSCLKIVHFYTDAANIPANLEASRRALDELYPKMTVDVLLVQDEFTPRSVRRLSERMRIPRSFMLMSCPGPDFPYGIGELGGVRIAML